MKKLIASVVMLFAVSSASAGEEVVMSPPPNGLSTAGIFFAAGLVAIALTDEVQACDSLPIKTEKASGGNYTYDVPGCDQ